MITDYFPRSDRDQMLIEASPNDGEGMVGRERTAAVAVPAANTHAPGCASSSVKEPVSHPYTVSNTEAALLPLPLAQSLCNLLQVATGEGSV